MNFQDILEQAQLKGAIEAHWMHYDGWTKMYTFVRVSNTKPYNRGYLTGYFKMKDSSVKFLDLHPILRDHKAIYDKDSQPRA